MKCGRPCARREERQHDRGDRVERPGKRRPEGRSPGVIDDAGVNGIKRGTRPTTRAREARRVGPEERGDGSAQLDAARRTLGVDTETEAIDLALDFVAFRREVAEGLAAMRRAGGIDDVLESRRRP